MRTSLRVEDCGNVLWFVACGMIVWLVTGTRALESFESCETSLEVVSGLYSICAFLPRSHMTNSIDISPTFPNGCSFLFFFPCSTRVPWPSPTSFTSHGLLTFGWVWFLSDLQLSQTWLWPQWALVAFLNIVSAKSVCNLWHLQLNISQQEYSRDRSAIIQRLRNPSQELNQTRCFI